MRFGILGVFDFGISLLERSNEFTRWADRNLCVTVALKDADRQPTDSRHEMANSRCRSCDRDKRRELLTLAGLVSKPERRNLVRMASVVFNLVGRAFREDRHRCNLSSGSSPSPVFPRWGPEPTSAR